jgi:hypothetical protein
MATYFSIRERILARLAAICGTLSGIHGVLRWDARGTTAVEHLDVLILPQDDELLGESLGNAYAVTTRMLPVLIGINIAAGAEAAVSDTLRNAWLADIQAAVLADRSLTEPAGGPRLALDVAATMLQAPEEFGGLIDTAVVVAVEYQTYTNNPTAGPGITAVAIDP